MGNVITNGRFGLSFFFIPEKFNFFIGEDTHGLYRQDRKVIPRKAFMCRNILCHVAGKTFHRAKLEFPIVMYEDISYFSTCFCKG